jgi:hypothetical protein
VQYRQQKKDHQAIITSGLCADPQNGYPGDYLI